MIRAVVGLAAAAVLLVADPAAASAIGGGAAAGAGSPSPAAISAAAGTAAAGEKAVAGRTELTVSYLADQGPSRAVVLRCHPTGGTHPKRVKACRLLTKINGDPDLLEPAPLMCTLEYAPVTALIAGSWKGRNVDWSRRFGNRCEMRRTTGVLMEF
ncbi:SSI family serine proteinase inhibitor [Actinoplanes sp. NPDC026623]|uniref:SSI family serine proteinase inhibitor n=1 Tax=Actinoplanes sp. NPDC026623 TaxID=3155610 RepID=UPI0033CDD12C